jgi:hypothetical protein
MPQEKASSSGALLPASLMYFCSGQLMHFCSGVDIRRILSRMWSMIGAPRRSRHSGLPRAYPRAWAARLILPRTYGSGCIASISVASSALARELFTRFDTAHR